MILAEFCAGEYPYNETGAGARDSAAATVTNAVSVSAGSFDTAGRRVDIAGRLIAAADEPSPVSAWRLGRPASLIGRMLLVAISSCCMFFFRPGVYFEQQTAALLSLLPSNGAGQCNRRRMLRSSIFTRRHIVHRCTISSTVAGV
jgi:hypothetical protein